MALFNTKPAPLHPATALPAPVDAALRALQDIPNCAHQFADVWDPIGTLTRAGFSIRTTEAEHVQFLAAVHAAEAALRPDESERSAAEVLAKVAPADVRNPIFPAMAQIRAQAADARVAWLQEQRAGMVLLHQKSQNIWMLVHPFHASPTDRHSPVMSATVVMDNANFGDPLPRDLQAIFLPPDLLARFTVTDTQMSRTRYARLDSPTPRKGFEFRARDHVPGRYSGNLQMVFSLGHVGKIYDVRPPALYLHAQFTSSDRG